MRKPRAWHVGIAAAGLAAAGVSLAATGAGASTAPRVSLGCSSIEQYITGGDSPTISCRLTTSDPTADLNELYYSPSNAGAPVAWSCALNGRAFGTDGDFCEPGGFTPTRPVDYVVTFRAPTRNYKPYTLTASVCADGQLARGTQSFSFCKKLTFHVLAP
jgi:hypothetical protein